MLRVNLDMAEINIHELTVAAICKQQTDAVLAQLRLDAEALAVALTFATGVKFKVQIV